MHLIGELGYIGETTSKLFRLVNKIAETGKENDFFEFANELGQAISCRDSLSEYERNAVSESLKDKYYKEIRTGEYLDYLKGLVDAVKSAEDAEFDMEDILTSAFGEALEDLNEYDKITHRDEIIEDIQKGKMLGIYDFLTGKNSADF